MKNEQQESRVKNPVSLRWKLLFLLSSTISFDTRTSSLLGYEAKQILHALEKLKKDGLIRCSSTRPMQVTWTQKGLDVLRREDPDVYAYYMRISNDNRPGGDAAHCVLRKRDAEVKAMMFAAGVGIGAQNPGLMDVLSEQAKPLRRPQAAYYSSRELIFGNEQKQTRMRRSRSSGLLLSPGFQGRVYHPDHQEFRLSVSAELTVNVLAVQLANKLYRELGVREITESLLICDESEVLRIFETESHGKRHTIGDAVRLPGITRTSYRYIPLSTSGVELLNFITKVPKRNIQIGVFETLIREELGREALPGELTEQNLRQGYFELNGYREYEFLSSDVTVLYRLLKQNSSEDTHSLSCWRSQEKLIRSIFRPEQVRLWIFRDEDMEADQWI